MNIKEILQKKLTDVLTGIVDDVTKKAADQSVETPTAAPTLDVTAIASAVTEAVSKSIEGLQSEITTLKEQMEKSAAAASTTETVKPEDANAKLAEASAALAKELGVAPEDITVTLKEQKQSGSSAEQEQIIHKAKQDEAAADGGTLDEQLAKATPEEKKSALGAYFKGAMGV